ncbi:hypothetical protein C1645_806760 [Glomus cerebriforme]|uniref:Uncharacterized protein n=1 Tax=Glomus cerebriforme TaxID=658196 RepID=A0A397SRZ7_9GLOM|nr:hypothetical protein C1645_806760 [Glomus cerebriforme]
MNFIIIYFIFLLLRVGLVKGITYDGIDDNSIKHKYDNSSIIPNNNITSEITPDACANVGLKIINNCTFDKPYCFVDGDNISCGSIDKIGWRISPLDGLILNNGQKPDQNCELFTPPGQINSKVIILTLLNQSVFGSQFLDHESAWFNIFEDLGNCPFKSQFCDKDSLTCQNLFGAGKNCTSSNQCFSRYCEKYDQNAPDNSTVRRCVEETTTQNQVTKPYNNNDGYSDNKSLIIIISISVGSSIMILGLTVFLIKALRNQKSPSRYSINNTTNSSQSGFVTSYLPSLNSGFLSIISSRRSNRSKSIKKHSSDRFSVLLPPPPTLHLYNNNNDLNNNSYMNNENSSNSSNIYLSPNGIQQQYEYSFI